MKRLLLILLILFPTTFYSQVNTPSRSSAKVEKVEASKICTHTLSDIPLYQGVRYGMTYDEVMQIYPEIKDDAWFHKTFDVENKGLFMIDGAKLSNSEFKQNVLQLSLYFLDGKVNIVNVVFDSEKWNSIGHTLDDLSSVFSVDNNYWTVFYNESAELKCKDYTIYGSHLKDSNGYQNSIAIHPKIAEPK